MAMLLGVGAAVVMIALGLRARDAERLLALRRRARLFALLGLGAALPFVVLGLHGMHRVLTAVGGESIDPHMRDRIQAVGMSMAMNCIFTALIIAWPLAIASLVVTLRAKRFGT